LVQSARIERTSRAKHGAIAAAANVQVHSACFDDAFAVAAGALRGVSMMREVDAPAAEVAAEAEVVAVRDMESATRGTEA